MKRRSIGIIGLACLTAGIGLAGCGASSNTTETTNLFEEETEMTTQTTEVSKFESDIDVITKEGHPVILDDFNNAIDFWDYPIKNSYKVAYESTGDNTVLYVDEVERVTDKKSIINYVDILAHNIEGKEKMSLEEAMDLAQQYLPKAEVMKYYNYDESFVVYPQEKKDYKEEYVIQYKLNDEGQSIKNKEDNMWHSQFDIRIETNENQEVQSICVGMSEMKAYMKYPEQYNYIREDWNGGKLKDY